MPTVAAPVMSLLAAVQRWLWRARLQVAVRGALWASAAVLLLLTGGHLLGFAGAPLVASVGLAALWLVALGWAAAQRPGDAACALWADRHLGGASAFSTLLESAQAPRVTAAAADSAVRHSDVRHADVRHAATQLPAAPSAAAHRAAVACMQQWALQRVPASRLLLASQRMTPPLTQPLLVTLVCGALAAAVWNLQPVAPAAQGVTAQTAAAAASSPGAASASGASAVLARAPDTEPLVGELSQALRAAAPRKAAAGGGAAQAPAAGDAAAGGQPPAAGAQAPPSPADPQPAPAPATPPARRPAADAGAPPASADAPPASGTAQTAAPTRSRVGISAATDGSRQAGDSPDQRADAGMSRVPQGPMALQRSTQPKDAVRPPATSPLMADGAQAAAYDPALDAPSRATMGSAAATPLAAAATPPTATHSQRLSATEHHYVQAWMKARAQRP